MDISNKGLKFITSFEKEVLHAYNDGYGYLTIGIGHLIVAGDGFDRNSRITHEQAQTLFHKDLQKYVATINSSVKVPINQNQFDALCSLCFNIGREAFRNSSLVRVLNQKRYSDAAERITHWNRANGQVSRGLVNRRQAEKQIFLTQIREITPENIGETIDDLRHSAIPKSSIIPLADDETPIETSNQIEDFTEGEKPVESLKEKSGFTAYIPQIDRAKTWLQTLFGGLSITSIAAYYANLPMPIVIAILALVGIVLVGGIVIFALYHKQIFEYVKTMNTLRANPEMGSPNVVSMKPE